MIGKKAKYMMRGYPEGHLFSLSSSLDDIGRVQDVNVPNGIEVTILSEPTKIVSPRHGELEVIKVFAGKQPFWARMDSIFEIEDNRVWN